MGFKGFSKWLFRILNNSISEENSYVMDFTEIHIINDCIGLYKIIKKIYDNNTTINCYKQLDKSKYSNIYIFY